MAYNNAVKGNLVVYCALESSAEEILCSLISLAYKRKQKEDTSFLAEEFKPYKKIEGITGVYPGTVNSIKFYQLSEEIDNLLIDNYQSAITKNHGNIYVIDDSNGNLRSVQSFTAIIDAIAEKEGRKVDLVVVDNADELTSFEDGGKSDADMTMVNKMINQLNAYTTTHFNGQGTMILFLAQLNRTGITELALNQSTLDYEQLNRHCKMFDIKSLFNIRNIQDRKIIQILGIQIRTKRKFHIVKSEINTIKDNIEILSKENETKYKTMHNSLCYQTNLYNKVNSTHSKVFTKYKNLHNGETAVLIASGQTLNEFKPEYIKGKDIKYVAVNNSFEYEKINFDYLFLQDYSDLKESISKIPLAKNLKHAKKFYGVMSPVPDNMVVPESIALRDNAERYYVHSVCYDNGNLIPFVDYALDLSSEFLMCHGDIALIAMQFLLYANFKRIYLVGCDYSSNISDFKEQNIKLLGWQKLKRFKDKYYPDTEIISVNSIGLDGLFDDMYLDKTY